MPLKLREKKTLKTLKEGLNNMQKQQMPRMGKPEED